MQLGNGIYYSTCSLKAQHVSSGMSLIIRSSNCICSFWFTHCNKVKDLYILQVVYIKILQW